MNTELQAIIDNSRNRLRSLAATVVAEVVKSEPAFAADLHKLIDDAAATAKTVVADTAAEIVTGDPAPPAVAVAPAAPAQSQSAPAVGTNVVVH